MCYDNYMTRVSYPRNPGMPPCLMYMSLDQHEAIANSILKMVVDSTAPLQIDIG